MFGAYVHYWFIMKKYNGYCANLSIECRLSETIDSMILVLISPTFLLGYEMSFIG